MKTNQRDICSKWFCCLAPFGGSLAAIGFAAAISAARSIENHQAGGGCSLRRRPA
jgi:hypothetical protein